jgi:hypothetical protein
MADPNGNALAQAEWASPVFGTELLKDSQLESVAEAYEARALHEFREGRFGNVIAECEAWAESEPYSIRPFESACSAAAIIEQYEQSADIAARGLRLRPRGGQLLNCRAYALASMGLLEQAEELLRRIPDAVDTVTKLTKLANQGFISISRKQKNAAFLNTKRQSVVSRPMARRLWDFMPLRILQGPWRAQVSSAMQRKNKMKYGRPLRPAVKVLPNIFFALPNSG